MLPNQSCLTINIKRNQQTSEVIDIVLQKLQIPTKLTRNFGIFETVENNFGKILVSILKKRQISLMISDAFYFLFFFKFREKIVLWWVSFCSLCCKFQHRLCYLSLFEAIYFFHEIGWSHDPKWSQNTRSYVFSGEFQAFFSSKLTI